MEPDNIKVSKQKIVDLLDILTEISEQEEILKSQKLTYVDIALPMLVRESFSRKTERDLSMLSLQSPTWRLYFAITDHITESRLELPLPDAEEAQSKEITQERKKQEKGLKKVKFEAIKENDGDDTDDEGKVVEIKEEVKKDDGEIKMIS